MSLGLILCRRPLVVAAGEDVADADVAGAADESLGVRLWRRPAGDLMLCRRASGVDARVGSIAAVDAAAAAAAAVDDAVVAAAVDAAVAAVADAAVAAAVDAAIVTVC